MTIKKWDYFENHEWCLDFLCLHVLQFLPQCSDVHKSVQHTIPKRNTRNQYNIPYLKETCPTGVFQALGSMRVVTKHGQRRHIRLIKKQLMNSHTGAMVISSTMCGWNYLVALVSVCSYSSLDRSLLSSVTCSKAGHPLWVNGKSVTAPLIIKVDVLQKVQKPSDPSQYSDKASYLMWPYHAPSDLL